jgi:uncharacterized cupredoxin-like copper-binding protein
MTMRKDWTVMKTAAELRAQATARMKHHEDRLGFWKFRYEELKSQAGDAVSIVESMAMEAYGNFTATQFSGRGAARVALNPDFESKVREAVEKMAEHKARNVEYAEWLAFLEGMPELQSVTLHFDDYQFFYKV